MFVVSRYKSPYAMHLHKLDIIIVVVFDSFCFFFFWRRRHHFHSLERQCVLSKCEIARTHWFHLNLNYDMRKWNSSHISFGCKTKNSYIIRIAIVVCVSTSMSTPVQIARGRFFNIHGMWWTRSVFRCKLTFVDMMNMNIEHGTWHIKAHIIIYLIAILLV